MLGDLAVGGVVTVQLHDDEELRNNRPRRAFGKRKVPFIVPSGSPLRVEVETKRRREVCRVLL